MGGEAQAMQGPRDAHSLVGREHFWVLTEEALEHFNVSLKGRAEGSKQVFDLQSCLLHERCMVQRHSPCCMSDAWFRDTALAA